MTSFFLQGNQKRKLRKRLAWFGQVSSDAWKKKGVKNSQKIINICINLPSGKSVFSSVHQVVGNESLDHLYLKRVMLTGAKELYKSESSGLSQDCLGFIGDSESANLCVLRELESEILCDKQPFRSAVLLAEFIAKEVLAKADIRAKMKWCLEKPVDPDEANSNSTALPRLAVETRFASMILTMRDVLRCKAALEA
ncbi:TPA: hypothetical protein ACH3X1_012030 [Trebouxia sp. C0004]